MLKNRLINVFSALVLVLVFSLNMAMPAFASAKVRSEIAGGNISADPGVLDYNTVSPANPSLPISGR
jgi:hypothetical protein